MDYSKPTLIVIAGPPGAGKTTFGPATLPAEFWDWIIYDPDAHRREIAAEFKEDQFEDRKILTGASEEVREHLFNEMVDEMIARHSSFVYETPLLQPTDWLPIDRFSEAGYQIQLNYIGLDSPQDCMIRLQHRAEIITRNTGIPEVNDSNLNVVQQIYHETLKQIDKFDFYFNKIELWDGLKKPRLLASMENGKVLKAKPEAVKKNWITHGLPKVAEKIKPYMNAQSRSKGKKM